MGKALVSGLLNVCAFAAVLGVSQPMAAAPDASETKQLSATLDGILESGVKDHVYPGAALIVGRPGQRLYEKAVGHLTYETTSPAVTLHTLWDLASVSKVAGTATAAMLAIEDGKLKVTAPVSSHIPGFGVNGKEKATVLNLMTHTSGLPPYVPAASAEKERRPEQTTSDALISYYASLKARSEPGTTITYSCLNMQTTARIVEQVMDKRLEDLLRARVWEPLGMKDSAYLLSQDQLKRTAPTLETKGKLLVGKVHDPLASYHQSTIHCPGNAGLFSSADDLARYCEMIANGGKSPDGKTILKPETVSLMTSVQTPADWKSARGLGWDVDRNLPWATPLNNSTDTLVVSHTGYTGTLIWVDKKTKTYFVYLTNRVFPDDASKKGPSIAKLRRAVAEAVLKAQPEYTQVFANQKP